MIHLTMQQLSASVDDALVGVSLELVRRHLATCDDCRVTRDRLAKLDATLSRLIDHVPDAAALEDAVRHIESQIESEARGTRVRPPVAPAPAASAPRPAAAAAPRPAPESAAPAARIAPSPALSRATAVPVPVPVAARPATPRAVLAPRRRAPSGRRLHPALVATLAFAGAGGGLVALLAIAGPIRIPSFHTPELRLPALGLHGIRWPEPSAPAARPPVAPIAAKQPPAAADASPQHAAPPVAEPAPSVPAETAHDAVPTPVTSPVAAASAPSEPFTIAATAAAGRPRIETVVRAPAPAAASPAPAAAATRPTPEPVRAFAAAIPASEPAATRPRPSPARASATRAPEKSPTRATAPPETPAATDPPSGDAPGDPVAVATTRKIVTVTPAPSPAPDAPAAASPEESSERWPLVCGEVTDAAGEPVAGARVLLADLELGARTDRRGRFCLSAPPGDRTLSVVALGFTTHRRVVSLSSKGLELSIRMESTP